MVIAFGQRGEGTLRGARLIVEEPVETTGSGATLAARQRRAVALLAWSVSPRLAARLGGRERRRAFTGKVSLVVERCGARAE